MFALRGLAVSFSVFAIVYCTLSIAVSLAWRRVSHYSQRFPARQNADLLFAVRFFPFITAAIITAAFTVPSFLLLEPRSIDEPIGGVTLVFGGFGVLLGIFGLVNAGLTLRRASHTVSIWTEEAQFLEMTPVPVLRISRNFPPMTATGILRPKVLLSRAAEFVLNANELQTALNHEVAHVRRRDNLRKLLLRFIAFPGMRDLEGAWLQATEMAADDAAVSNAGEALDLAAALIKVSRLCPGMLPTDLTSALVHSPLSAMNARVERLIAWGDEPRDPLQISSPRYALVAAVATIAVFAITYSQLLVRVHTATEWLVR